MPQYLLSVNHVVDVPLPTGEAMDRIGREVDVVNKELMDTGAWVFAAGLHEPSASTVVQVKDGEVLTTDGPFSEAKEYIGGFWIIKARDLDEALAWARKATVACAAPIEVRPVHEGPRS
jgi:hypothetical protein